MLDCLCAADAGWAPWLVHECLGGAVIHHAAEPDSGLGDVSLPPRQPQDQPFGTDHLLPELQLVQHWITPRPRARSTAVQALLASQSTAIDLSPHAGNLSRCDDRRGFLCMTRMFSIEYAEALQPAAATTTTLSTTDNHHCHTRTHPRRCSLLPMSIHVFLHARHICGVWLSGSRGPVFFCLHCGLHSSTSQPEMSIHSRNSKLDTVHAHCINLAQEPPPYPEPCSPLRAAATGVATASTPSRCGSRRNTPTHSFNSNSVKISSSVRWETIATVIPLQRVDLGLKCSTATFQFKIRAFKTHLDLLAIRLALGQQQLSVAPSFL